MTAAPGPQQPDEVEALAQRLQQADPDAPRLASTDRPAPWENPHVDRDYYREFALALVGTLPAAPSAQPDEKDWRNETVEEQAARYGLPVELLNARVTFTAPAQPVRDTGEGRR